MSERAQEVRVLAAAIRDLIDRMVATAAPLEVFGGIAEDISEVARKFEPYPQVHLYTGVSEAGLANPDDLGSDYEGPFDNSPLMGRANPLAPPLKLLLSDDGAVTGTATFGSAYEGPPGHVHGGYVAAAFDEVLGLVQVKGGNPGMTGRLTVHYRSPTPLHTELRFRGWLDRVDGRKTICRGTVHVGDRLCAEAEGLFVAVQFAKLQALADQSDRQLER